MPFAILFGAAIVLVPVWCIIWAAGGNPWPLIALIVIVFFIIVANHGHSAPLIQALSLAQATHPV